MAGPISHLPCASLAEPCLHKPDSGDRITLPIGGLAAATGPTPGPQDTGKSIKCSGKDCSPGERLVWAEPFLFIPTFLSAQMSTCDDIKLEQLLFPCNRERQSAPEPPPPIPPRNRSPRIQRCGLHTARLSGAPSRQLPVWTATPWSCAVQSA